MMIILLGSELLFGLENIHRGKDYIVQDGDIMHLNSRLIVDKLFRACFKIRMFK